MSLEFQPILNRPFLRFIQKRPGGAALGQGFLNYLNLIFRQNPNDEVLAKLEEQKLMLQQVLDKLNQSP